MKILENNKNSRWDGQASFYVTLVIFVAGFVCVGCWKAQSQDPTGTDTSTDTSTETTSDSSSESETNPSGSFVISQSLSEAIGTVGIIEWSLPEKTVESAYIEFGLDEEYGMVAPVELEEPDYRTLLLGMKPSREYNFRIVANDGTEDIYSSNQILETGPVSNLLPQQVVESGSQSQLAGGFILSCFYIESRIFIMDSDGEYVWWSFPSNHRCSRARMSYDGKHVLVKDVNVNANEGFLIKISMDGLEEEVFEIPKSHHDFTVLPDGTVTFIFFDGLHPQCDDVVEMSPDGTFTTIFKIRDFIEPLAGSEDGCHSNSIHYNEEDDSYTVSVLNTNQYVKVKRSGELVWVFGGEESNSFDGVSWNRQHGHHILDDGNVLIFNNGESEDEAVVREYSLDETIWQASQVWSYVGGDQSKILGDVQRLTGGNTLITYSSDGIMQEIDSEGNLLRRLSFMLSGGVGYTMWRETLYGPPPKNLTP